MAVVARVATHQGWPLRGVPLYMYTEHICTWGGFVYHAEFRLHHSRSRKLAHTPNVHASNVDSSKSDHIYCPAPSGDIVGTLMLL